MKLQRLEINNYRAIAHADIPLSEVTAAAIVGVNGVGKSTVVEAISWALFGDAKHMIRSSTIGQIVKLGATEASVQLEYSHGGNAYRVIRKYSRKSKRSTMDYMIMSDGEWQTLSGASIAETQRKLSADLGIDSELWAASSCSTQSKSAGICEAGPTERKAVLYRILADKLAPFSVLFDAAKARVKSLDDGLVVFRDRRASLENKVALKPELERSRDTSNERLSDAQAEYDQAQRSLDKLKQQRTQLSADIDKLASLRERLTVITREITSVQEAISGCDSTIGEAKQLLASANSIRAQCAEADKLEQEISELEKRAESYRALCDQHKTEVAEHQAKDSAFQREIDAAKRNLSEEQGTIKTEIVRLEAGIREVESAIGRATKRSAQLDAAPCKTCSSAGKCFEECPFIADARTEAGTVDDRRTTLTNESNALNEANRKLADITKASNAEVGAIQERRDNAENEHMKRLAKLKTQADAIGYSSDDHKAKREAFEQAKGARAKLASIATAEERVSQQESQKATLESQLSAKHVEANDLRLQIDALAPKISEAQILDTQITSAESEVRAAQDSLSLAIRTLANDEQALKACIEQEAELEQCRCDAESSEHLRSVYATLQQAYSRDGIPALIIDAVLPQIEEVANDMLTRLSGGKMHVHFTTQKVNSDGGVRETLDIIVSDPEGERPYEDYSGGEKVRVDLAVRFALGSVLAQRTGSRVKTMILDEVCAPLDLGGKEALMECIEVFASVFDTILLITHDERLKDRLREQIVVTKNGHGSEVALVA